MNLNCPLRVGVMGKHPLAGPLRDRTGTPLRQSFEMRCNLFAVIRDQNLAARLEKAVDSIPPISDQASARSRSLEDPRRW